MGKMENPFVLKTEEYKRDINVIEHYIDDNAWYLSKMTKRPYEHCREYVIRNMKPGGRFEFKDPKVMYLHRDEHGDRSQKAMGFSKFLRDVVQNRELIAPTFTTYLHPSVRESLLVPYIDENVAMRAAAKKEEFIAMQNKNSLRRTLKKIEQMLRKIRNNAISGSHVTPSTPMYNPTGHSTLTSICRSTSGYGNANNEKFVAGNRHYWSPGITTNNIISIVNHTNYELMEEAMKVFGIRYPSAEETISCIKYSTDLYWDSRRHQKQIEQLIYRLSPAERAAVVYTGDLFHLMLCNENVVRDFITKLGTRIGVPHPEADRIINNCHGDNLELAMQLCPNETRGKNFEDLKGTEQYAIVASTVEHVEQVLTEYKLFIRAFFVTVNMPASMAHLPKSIRRVALVSDTDSTIFTVQDWVIWHQGKLAFDEPAHAVSAVMIFLASQTITHILARMSANYGIETKRLHQITMKNEYKFDIFVPTQVAKHYYAVKSVQEGNVKDELEEEIKGVHLKNSNVAKDIIKEAQAMMRSIMDAVMAGEMINLSSKLRQVADAERRVVETIRRGDSDFFKTTQIKNADSYTKEKENSPYQHYTFWNEVFGPKYGMVDAPPFGVLKISVDLNSNMKMKHWMANMKDRELAARLERWRERDGKNRCITTFQVPQSIVMSNGIPDEIFQMIDYRRIVLDTTKVFYLVLETLGHYSLNKRITRLCMDEY